MKSKDFSSTCVNIMSIYLDGCHADISKHQTYQCIYIYIYIQYTCIVYISTYQLSIFPTHSKNQGTKTLVPLEPNVLFADLKDSLRPAKSARFANLKLGGFCRVMSTNLFSVMVFLRFLIIVDII